MIDSISSLQSNESDLTILIKLKEAKVKKLLYFIPDTIF